MYVCDTDTPTISPGACGANFIWAFGLQYQIRRAIVSNVRSCFVWTDTDLIEPSVIKKQTAHKRYSPFNQMQEQAERPRFS